MARRLPDPPDPARHTPVSRLGDKREAAAACGVCGRPTKYLDGLCDVCFEALSEMHEEANRGYTKR